MQLRFTQVLAGLRQAQQFLDANGTTLGDVNAGGARQEFDTITVRLATLAETQDTHRMGATGELSNERRMARALRRQHMKPIVKIARAKVPAAAQLSAVTLPPIRSNSTDLATRARAMAHAVEPYRQLMHEGGLPADFIERLNAAAGALEQAIGHKGGHKHNRIGATDGIRQEVEDARIQLDVVDSLVRARLGERESLVTQWQNIVRVVRAAASQASKPAVVPVAPASEAPGTQAA